MHFPLEIMLVCGRWYAAYPLSLRNLEEMMAERGVLVDHATVHQQRRVESPALAPFDPSIFLPGRWSVLAMELS